MSNLSRIKAAEASIGHSARQPKCVCGRPVLSADLDGADIPHCVHCGAVVELPPGPVNLYVGIDDGAIQ